MDPSSVPEAERHAALHALGEAAYNFYSKTHGSDLTHDHHCPVPASGREKPGDAKRCTCGWSNFERAFQAYDAMQP